MRNFQSPGFPHNFAKNLAASLIYVKMICLPVLNVLTMATDDHPHRADYSVDSTEPTDRRAKACGVPSGLRGMHVRAQLPIAIA
jgi:hypothetical protein